MEQQRDFKGVWIDRKIWLDKDLNALDKVILAEIDSLDCDGKGCFASNEYLAEFCQCSKEKITKTISKLKELGFVSLENFDGRVRVLRSRLVKNTRQTSKKYEADKENLRCYNNNITNNTNNNKKESKKESDYDNIINSNIKDDSVRNALLEFIKMRKLAKSPMTNRALELLISRLRKLADTPEMAVKVLEQSIVNNWKNIYELKENKEIKHNVEGYNGEYAGFI